jgi:hypothetical protein
MSCSAWVAGSKRWGNWDLRKSKFDAIEPTHGEVY